MKVSSRCPVCNSKKLKFIQKRNEWLQNKIECTKISFNDILCQNCDFLFSDPSISRKQLNKYYKNYFSSLSDINSNEISNRLDFFKKNLNKNSKILEIGGGKGEFQKKLKEIFLIVDNDDLSSLKVKFKETYDCICSFYLMEHIYHIDIWMDEYLKKLKYGGIFILEVPNFEKYPFESLNNEHLYHFKPLDMVNFLSKKGVEVQLCDEKNASRYFGFRIMGIKKDISSFKLSLNNKKSLKLINSYNKHLEIIEKQILKLNEDIKNIPGNVGILPCNKNTIMLINSIHFSQHHKAFLFDRDKEKKGLDWGNSSLKVNNSKSKSINNCSSFVITSKVYFNEIKKQLLSLDNKLTFKSFYGLD